MFPEVFLDKDSDSGGEAPGSTSDDDVMTPEEMQRLVTKANNEAKGYRTRLSTANQTVKDQVPSVEVVDVLKEYFAVDDPTALAQVIKDEFDAKQKSKEPAPEDSEFKILQRKGLQLERQVHERDKTITGLSVVVEENKVLKAQNTNRLIDEKIVVELGNLNYDVPSSMLNRVVANIRLDNPKLDISEEGTVETTTPAGGLKTATEVVEEFMKSDGQAFLRPNVQRGLGSQSGGPGIPSDAITRENFDYRKAVKNPDFLETIDKQQRAK